MGLPKWLKFVEQAAPTILIGFGVPPVIAGAVAVGIQEAEALAKPGADKLDHVKGVAHAAAVGVNGVKPGTVDVTALDAVLDHGVAAVVAAANIHKKAA